jgi:hypothetical protein
MQFKVVFFVFLPWKVLMAKVEEGDVSEVDASVVDGPVELISKLVFIFAKNKFIYFC